MKIQLVDLHAQYLTIKEDIDEAIKRTIADTSFIGGDEVRKFEQAFAQYIGVNHCVGCANGTDAIEIMLQAMGIGKGDEVIVPAISWISTSEAVSSVGATPVFVDIDPDTYCIDAKLIEAAINARTKAIIPVHLYGHPANMDSIMDIAGENNLLVLEDCAQAHGAEWNSQRVGSFGHAATFSFYPGKNLGAYGDAGGMVTNNSELAGKARMIANHGQKGKHNHLMEGRNSRLDGLQAAILNVKLSHLDHWTALRISHAGYYQELLKDTPLKLPHAQKETKHVYHLYVARTGNRSKLMDFLKQNGISTGIHYPQALPFLPCYQNLLDSVHDFPEASSAVSEVISLPLFPELTKGQLEHVATSIKNFF